MPVGGESRLKNDPFFFEQGCYSKNNPLLFEQAVIDEKDRADALGGLWVLGPLRLT